MADLNPPEDGSYPPDGSKKPWDYYKTRATTPAEQAFRPIDQGDCPLVKK